MRFLLFFGISLTLHGLLFFAGAPPLSPPPPEVFEVRITPPPAPEGIPDPEILRDQLSTDAVAQTLPAAPHSSPPDPADSRTTRMQQQQARLLKNLLYPAAAIAQGLEGEVIVLITFDTRGNIIGTTLARSSGHGLLDQAALAAAAASGRNSGKARELLIPVSFTLD